MKNKLKQISKFLLLAALVGVLFTITGCNNSDQPPIDDNIVDNGQTNIGDTVDIGNATEDNIGDNTEDNTGDTTEIVETTPPVEEVEPVAIVNSEAERLAYILNVCRYGKYDGSGDEEYPAKWKNTSYMLSLMGIESKWVEECAIALATEPVHCHAVAIFKTADKYKNNVALALYNYRSAKIEASKDRLPRQKEQAEKAEVFRQEFNGVEYTIMLMCPNSDLVKDRVIEYLEKPGLIKVDPDYVKED